MRWFLLVVVMLTGTVFADGLIERIRARGRCRRVLVSRNDVIVKFNCNEDAELFARDLANLIKDWD